MEEVQVKVEKGFGARGGGYSVVSSGGVCWAWGVSLGVMVAVAGVAGVVVEGGGCVLCARRRWGWGWESGALGLGGVVVGGDSGG